MSRRQTKPAKGVRWDLSDLYSGMNDPRIKKDRREIEKLTKRFINKYKSKINSPHLTVNFLLQALKDYEAIREKAYVYEFFCEYLHSQNTASASRGKFYQEGQEFSNWITAQFLWFELEWVKLGNSHANRLLRSPKLPKYRHYLAKERLFKPFRLSEKEEVVLTKKDQSGEWAFKRLYDEIDANLKFSLKVKGKLKKLSLSELLPYLSLHQDRRVRKRAAGALTSELQRNSRLFTFILNTLLLDKKIIDEIRDYKYPQQETFLDYEVKPETVEKMISVIEKHYSIAERFYQIKRKLLGHNQLYEWDRYSLIYPQFGLKYSWQEAREAVLSSFEGFSPLFRKVAQEFFEKQWIDAEITPGKKTGAFCGPNVPSKHPYIMVNFTGRVRDVMTLAHELGHGIHAYLSRKQNLLEFYPSFAVAEIASVFGEMLVFESLMQRLADKKAKINFLANRIQDGFATIFRQSAFYLFETDIHQHRRKKGELKTDDFNRLYQRRLQAMFGKGLKLTTGHQYRWMPVSHFYQYNFYVFTYSLGQVLAMALYARYKKKGQKFVKKYLEALAAGGSKDPYEITRMLGVDINRVDFWNEGLDLIKGQVDEFQKLAG